MNVVALIKAVPDLTQSRYSKSEMKLQEKGPRLMPPVSENVLEAVRQIKESNQNVSTRALLLGNQAEDVVLRKALAFGLDQASLILGNVDAYDPYLKSRLIVKALEKLGVPDVLVVGGDSGFGSGGQVGIRVAELLGFENAETVNDIASASASSRKVLLVEQDTNQPRIPNIMAVMKAGSKELTTLKAEELLTGEEFKPVQIISREEWLG